MSGTNHSLNDKKVEGEEHTNYRKIFELEKKSPKCGPHTLTSEEPFFFMAMALFSAVQTKSLCLFKD